MVHQNSDGYAGWTCMSSWIIEPQQCRQIWHGTELFLQWAVLRFCFTVSNQVGIKAWLRRSMNIDSSLSMLWHNVVLRVWLLRTSIYHCVSGWFERRPDFGGFRCIFGRRGKQLCVPSATKARSRALPFCTLARKADQRLVLCIQILL